MARGTDPNASGDSKDDTNELPNPVVAIDPRIASRRQAVEGSQRKRRVARIGSVVGVVALVGLGLAAAYTPLLGISTVEVDGASGATETAIRAAVASADGQAALRVDTAALARKVDAVAGVSEARVDTQWPSTLVVSVSMAKRVAYIASEPIGTAEAEQVMIVSEEGEVISLEPQVPQDMLRIDGFAPDPKLGATVPDSAMAAVKTAAAINKRLEAWVVAVSVDGSGQVRLKLSNHGQVIIGDAKGLASKLRSTESLLSGQITLACLATIDVRIPEAVSITRDKVCTGEENP